MFRPFICEKSPLLLLYTFSPRMSIVNLKQGKIDECYHMVKDGIEICNDIQFKEYFFKFKLFLETNHNCGQNNK